MQRRTIANTDELFSLAGADVAVSDWVEIGQERIDAFAQATNDSQWVHVDPQRARQSPFGDTIAHGFLTLSLLTHMMDTALTFPAFAYSVNYGLERVRFTAPVKAKSRIRARFALKHAENAETHVQLTWSVTVEIEGGDKPACVAEWLTRHYD